MNSTNGLRGPLPRCAENSGPAARMYFGVFPSMLADLAESFGAEFSQLGRNRRPPLDPLNALLSFYNGIVGYQNCPNAWIQPAVLPSSRWAVRWCGVG